MGDLETRLASVLAEMGEQAPDAGGLASGARERLGRRRRRRARGVVLGAAVAVVAVATTLAVVGTGSPAPDPAPDVDDGWHTVTVGGVSMEVPGDSSVEDRVFVMDDAQYDPYPRTPTPGELTETGGTVRVGDAWVTVRETDHETLRRMLASARPEGEPVPDVAEWNTRYLAAGVSYEVPAGETVRIELNPWDPFCSGELPAPAHLTGRGWLTGVCNGRSARILAPTQALADVVAQSIRPAAEGVGTEWSTVTVSGTSLEVPPGWAPCGSDDGIGPAGGCRGPRVLVTSEASVDWIGVPGILLDEDEGGAVLVDDMLVTSADLDRETSRRILASARPAGDPAPDVAEWELRYVGGLLGEVPVGDVVDIQASTSPVDCGRAADAAPGPDGGWVATYCNGRQFAVTAPTQALADIVVQSLVADDQPTPEGAWAPITLDDVTVDVPPGWEERDDVGCDAVYRGQGATVEQAYACSADGGLLTVTPLTTTIRALGLRGAEQGGTVVADGHTVAVSGVDPTTARRILASVRPAGEPGVDVTTWRTLDLGGGVSVEMPAGDQVDVRLLDGYPYCARVRSPAAFAGGRWRSSLCDSRIVTVAAPTQALADVVASTARGW